jgi:DNA polymerase (family 10)
MEHILDAAKKHRVAMECNAYPDRLDLKDIHLRMAKERGLKVVISTDAHSSTHFKMMKYGVITARRGWMEKKDVINTLPLAEFLAALRPRPGVANAPAATKAAKRKSV